MRSHRPPSAELVLVLVLTACGGATPPPHDAVALPATTSAPDRAAAPPPPPTVDDPTRAFIQNGARDVDPEDPGVFASADRPTLDAATARAKACLTTAKVKARLRTKIVLSDDGTPTAELLAVEPAITSPVARCVLDALARGRYTKPGTASGANVTKRFFYVRVEVVDPPQEYQVD